MRLLMISTMLGFTLWNLGGEISMSQIQHLEIQAKF